jgi:MFS family permease
MKTILKILLLSSFLISFSAGLFGPIYAVFVEEIGGDLLTAGSAFAAFSIVSGILIYFLGKWEDKIKHKENILIISRFLTIFGTAGYLLIQTPIHLFAVQIVLGISAALITPAFDGLYSKNLTKGKYASQWGLWESMYSITVGVAAIIGGFVAQNYGFQTLFIIMTFLAILSFISTLLLKKQIRKSLK